MRGGGGEGSDPMPPHASLVRFSQGEGSGECFLLPQVAFSPSDTFPPASRTPPAAVPKPKPSYGVSARRAAPDELPTAEISNDEEESGADDGHGPRGGAEGSNPPSSHRPLWGLMG